MKILYTIIGTIFFSGLVFSQTVEINGPDDNVNYAGDTVYISGGNQEISKAFNVKNTGSITQFRWSRTVVSQSSNDFMIQLCDGPVGGSPLDGICMNTTGEYWIGPVRTIQSGDAMEIKPQMSLMGVSGTAEVKYFVLDASDSNKIDSLTVMFTSTASVKKNEDLKFSLYPNPVQDIVTIKGEAIKNGGTVVFLDALGKEIKRTSVSAANNQINVSSLKRGVYFVNVYDQNGTKSTVQRLIKQ
ncbi:MAG TPA: T9SS type A sorting domain-containing protein [Brumimicrobium sp.]|nr:T9SS type A sorting domain-containing protein [Brumimicrobium sp.]